MSQRRPRSRFAIGLALAFGGAIFFALPLFMTMEMWWLGFYMHRLRLALFLAAFIPVLVGLSHYAGFEGTDRWSDDVRDAFVALFVGFATSAGVLLLAGAVDLEKPLREAVGAALAESLLGATRPNEERKRRKMGYGGELFLMAAGAIFFAFNIAPTEEMMVVAFKMDGWRVVAAAVVSLVLMHAFVYAVELRGGHGPHDVAEGWSLFLRFTVVGYAIVLLMSAYVLWTFGRLDDASLDVGISTTIVLAFPASLGAAVARLVL